MTPNETELRVRGHEDERPEFTTERLALDAAAATELICDAVGGVTATETPGGTKFRTQSGMLIAIVTEADEGTVDLQYRTAPASASATLKARRLWRSMRPYAV